MRQLLDFYKFATDHTASRHDFWSTSDQHSLQCFEVAKAAEVDAESYFR